MKPETLEKFFKYIYFVSQYPHDDSRQEDLRDELRALVKAENDSVMLEKAMSDYKEGRALDKIYEPEGGDATCATPKKSMLDCVKLPSESSPNMEVSASSSQPLMKVASNPPSDLQAARKALGIIKRSLDESVDRGINDNRMKHMLEILLTSEEYETVIAALNAELEKSK